MNSSIIKPIGWVEATIEYDDGRPTEKIEFKNTVLRNGRIALIKSLLNDIGDAYDFYVSRMIFGTNGATGGVKKLVRADRSALFGVTELSKPVIGSRDGTTAIFTSVVSRDDANGTTLNEIGLRMNNGDLYSMATWSGTTKTSSMQITYVWKIQMI